MRILVIEDEPGIADFVGRALRSEGHAVTLATDGIEGERLAVTGDADLVVLDGRLPGRDGLDVVRGIRTTRPELPVIMLTARGEVADRVAGLDAGATDYLAKPFAVEELLARVRAHLRTPAQSASTRLAAAGIELDLLNRTVTRDGREVHCSAKEFELLAYFLRHPNQVLSRAQLHSGVWGYDHDPQTNIVEVYVGYLR
ncbi:MAG: response regulator transcription factor, partial [Solirubrobacterales bacterium]|nr:response regulator transcription factor [Solirubrobacterales bacterium]